MKVKELLELTEGTVIAESSFDGRQLFDTSNNIKSYIEKYRDYHVCTVCGDVVAKRGKYDFYSSVKPVLRIVICRYGPPEEEQ